MKRPSFFFEKTIFFPLWISKTPPEDGINFKLETDEPYFFNIEVAKLAALGK